MYYVRSVKKSKEIWLVLPCEVISVSGIELEETRSYTTTTMSRNYVDNLHE